jgi:hypothetical protein
MKYISLFVICLFLIVGCNEENITSSKNNSEITLNVSLSKISDSNTCFDKPSEITRIVLTVTGPDMSEISRNLNISGNVATGSVTVPKGADRTFYIEGFDPANTQLFSGETTRDIRNDAETIQITANWIHEFVGLNVELPSLNINTVRADISGDGIQDVIERGLGISGTQAYANLDLPRGEKNVTIHAGYNNGSLLFEFFTGFYAFNLIQSGQTHTIDIGVNEDNQGQFYWHDNSFEGTAWGNQLDLLVVGFDVSSYNPVYVKTVIFEELSWGGNIGDFQVALYDGWNISTNNKFMSVQISPDGDRRYAFNLNYGSPHDGFFDGLILAGIRYLSTSLYPDLAYDTNGEISMSCFRYSYANSNWITLDNGDLGITLVVKFPSGATAELKPSKIKNIQTFARQSIKGKNSK